MEKYERTGELEADHFVTRVIEEYEEMLGGNDEIRKRDAKEDERRPGETFDQWDERMAFPPADHVLSMEMMQESFRDFWKEEVPEHLKAEVMHRLDAAGKSEIVKFIREYISRLT